MPLPSSPTPQAPAAVFSPRVRRGLELLTALGLLGFASPVRGQSQEFHPNLRHWCQDEWMLSTRAIRACLDADYRQADAELNRVYQATLAPLSPRARETLRESERAWLRRYDSTLTAYYSQPWADHSILKVLPSQIRAVRDRTEFLRAYRSTPAAASRAARKGRGKR